MSDEIVLSPEEQAAVDAAAGLIKDNTGLGQQADPKPTQKAAPAAGAVAPEDTTGKPAQQQPGAGAEPGTPVGSQPQQPVTVTTPFGTQTYGQQGGPVLSSWEDITAYAKEQGMEIKEADDIRQLFTSVADLTKKVETVPGLEATVAAYKNQMNSLPVDVVNIVDASVAGKDYRAIIKNIAAGVEVDLNKTFETQGQLDMVRRYVDASVTKEGFDDISDANKSAMLNMAKVNYTSAQTNWNKTQVDGKANKEAFDTKFAQSIDIAVQGLKQQYPTMDEASIKKVTDVMSFGLRDSLFNPDNTYKPDAGVKIAMQEYGQAALTAQKETFGEYVKKTESRIQGDTNEQLLRRSEKPELQGRQVGDESNAISQSVDQATSFLKAR